jgi:hypothetical protein
MQKGILYYVSFCDRFWFATVTYLGIGLIVYGLGPESYAYGDGESCSESEVCQDCCDGGGCGIL